MADKNLNDFFDEELKKQEEETPVMKRRALIRFTSGLLEDTCKSDICAYRGKNVCTYRVGEHCPNYKNKED